MAERSKTVISGKGTTTVNYTVKRGTSDTRRRRKKASKRKGATTLMDPYGLKIKNK